MKSGNKIYYLIPDFPKAKFSFIKVIKEIRNGDLRGYLRSCFKTKKRAIGGLKIFYQHCQILKKRGYSAEILCLGDFDGNVFFDGITSSSIKEVGFNLSEKDIVVSTEFSPYDGLLFKKATKIMFVQNWINIKKRLKDTDRDKSYRELGYDYVISCGEYITSSVKMINNEDCITISNGIDTSVFYPEKHIREPSRVMCLTRKNPEDLEAIIKIVHKQKVTANFVKLDGLTQQDIAMEFRKADIFLSVGYPEGFSLPPLEAMHSGCVVVGFAGRGGRQFMHHGKTALVAEDGDCVIAAKLLISVLQDSSFKETIRNQSMLEAKNYSMSNMEKQVISFYELIQLSDIQSK